MTSPKNDAATVRAAQAAIQAAETAMDEIEELIDDVIAVMGPEEAAHWLRSLAAHVETCSDVEGSA